MRAEEKFIAAKRVLVDTGAETRGRLEAKAEVGDRDVGILTDVLNKVKSASNGLKSAVIGSEKEIKGKSERSRSEVET